LNIDIQFLQQARHTYLAANRDALGWQLSRMQVDKPLINTKLNSLSLEEYTESDGMRGERYIYGWIQGRGLEAMLMHAACFKRSDPGLSHSLDEKAAALYTFLFELYAGQNGGYFCYDESLNPVCCAATEVVTRQQRDDDIFTYSDIFIVKGLIAAASRFDPHNLQKHLTALDDIIDAIRRGRFLLAESGDLTESALACQAQDFGPRMIALGAASMLHQLGLADHAVFSTDFIDHILVNHLDKQTGLVANVAGASLCNPGHGIEFAGFALELERETLSRDLAKQLGSIITASYRAGFNGIGIRLLVDIPSMKPIDSRCPWWSLPETVRAAALAYEATGSSDYLNVWKSAHDAFFTHFWRKDPPIAYQTLTDSGPIDSVPATPDLDPGYHTGLSFLGAINVVDRLMHSPAG